MHPTAAVSVTGTIDYEEFIAATVNLNRLEQEAAYQAAFQTFDTDGSGCLSVEEIGSALKVRSSCLLLGRPVGAYSSLYQATVQNLVQAFGVTDDDIKQVLDEVDTNHDGEIDYHGELVSSSKHPTVPCSLSSKASGTSCRAEFLAMMQANNSELQQAASFFRDRPGTISAAEPPKA